jgi:hypothetical protein
MIKLIKRVLANALQKYVFFCSLPNISPSICAAALSSGRAAQTAHPVFSPKSLVRFDYFAYLCALTALTYRTKTKNNQRT